jgi:hypothetical protein
MKNFIILSLFLIAVIALSSCDKTENFITDEDAKLSFSLDTLRFDTVFTSLGSATRSFKVYNEYDQPIRITNIRIEGNTASVFRMNVDGTTGTEVGPIEIWPNDSIYIFVEVTVDPDQPVSASPFIVEDKVLFETNGNDQFINLEAWGQNAVYLPSRFNKGVPVEYTCDNGEWVWDDPRPYVLYGEIFIDECLLRIPAGTHIYVHGGIAQNEQFGVFNDGILYIQENGKLQIEGTLEEPVIIEGDRLEEDFSEQAAQWYGIFLGKGSTGNSINFTTVKNGTFGFFVDSLAQLDIANSQFYNTGSSALISYHSTITAQNSLFYNNGSNSVELRFGGNYNFEHCTIANYGTDNASIAMTNWACLERDENGNCLTFGQNPLQVSMTNCIMAGSRRDQIVFSDFFEREEPSFFNVTMNNCITKVDDLLDVTLDGKYSDFFETICNNCILPANEDPLFLNRSEDDYHLDTLSIAIDKGLTITGIPLDIEGNSRIDAPDLGCFEYQY